MSVVCEDDGTITIEWDKDHPVTSILNGWTEQDFINSINEAANQVISEHDGK